MVARHPEAVKRATSYAERLRLGIAVIHGEEKSESERDDGRFVGLRIWLERGCERSWEWGIIGAVNVA